MLMVTDGRLKTAHRSLGGGPGSQGGGGAAPPTRRGPAGNPVPGQGRSDLQRRQGSANRTPGCRDEEHEDPMRNRFSRQTVSVALMALALGLIGAGITSAERRACGF